MVEWQPISTAPRDDTPVLIVDAEGEMTVASYVRARDGADLWPSTVYDMASVGQPTHWMPLPNPPA